MKRFLILAIMLLIANPGFAQVMRNPKNLKEAVQVLNLDATDSLKALIKTTADLDLKKISYPWRGGYEKIAYWTANRGDSSKISHYLQRKGISYEQDAVILKAFKQFLLGEPVKNKIIFQPFLELEKKAAREDMMRATADTLRGVYIPKNIEDSFKEIDLFWPDSAKAKLRNASELELPGINMMVRYTFVNGWQLISGSRLSKFFNDNGVYYPDEMSLIILTAYHRYLKNLELRTEELIQQSEERTQKAKQDQLAYDKIEFDKFNVGDTVLYTYIQGFSSQQQEFKYLDETCIARGKIIAKNTDSFQFNIKLLESCDVRGIITFDNMSRDLRTYMNSFGPKEKQLQKPKKRVVNYLKTRREYWFPYDYWYKP